MVTSRYALRKERRGEPVSGLPFFVGVGEVPYPRMAWIYCEAARMMNPHQHASICTALQQNCRKSWIKVMPHDKLRTPRCSPPPAPLSCVMTKTPEPWS